MVPICKHCSGLTSSPPAEPTWLAQMTMVMLLEGGTIWKYRDRCGKTFEGLVRVEEWKMRLVEKESETAQYGQTELAMSLSTKERLGALHAQRLRIRRLDLAVASS